MIAEGVQRRSEQGWETQAIDVARSMVDEAVSRYTERSRCEQQRAEEQLHFCEGFAKNLPDIIATSRTLQELGKWVAEPGWCPTASLCIDAREVSNDSGGPGRQSVARLAKWWREQHLGVNKVASCKAPSAGETICFRSGTCLCKNSRSGPVIKAMWTSASQGLRQLTDNQRGKEALKAGNVVFLWSAKQGDEMIVRATHIAVQYLRPWRPTFLEIKGASQEDVQLLQAIADRKEDGSRDEADVYVNMEVVKSSGEPLLHSATEFMKTLQADLVWRVCKGHLSLREVPFIGRAAIFRICFSCETESIMIWQGARDITKARRAETNRSDMLVAGSENLFEGMDDDTDDIEQSKDAGKAISEDISFDKDLMQMWEAAAQDAPQASDSSGTSSSSSSSDSSNEAEKKMPEAEKKDGDTATLAEREAAEAPASVARDRTNRLVFGAHHLVCRYRFGELQGYQMACACPGHVKCSKEVSASRVGSLSAARVLLKSWALIGPSLRSRQEHMAKDLRVQLEEARQSGRLLSEDTLDELADAQAEQASVADGMEAIAPFQSGSTQNLPHDALGGCGVGVPQEVHLEMLSLASQGSIPTTSPEARSRNKVCGQSSYEVPTTLRTALQFGYISPNVGAPEGLLWRARAGVWRLVPRGG